MSYNKTNWVNDETELNAQNMNHIEDGIEKSYGQILLAVEDTAPAECSTGDKYFNTTSKKIYTATGTNTWGTTGEDAELGVFYIVLEEQKSYTYDGTTLISVGGGGGGGIAVYPDEPEEDTKIYIEEEDLDFQGLEIANEYTIGDNVAYSVDYSNSAFGGTILWTNPNPTSEISTATNITLSSDDYDVLEVFYKLAYNNNYLLSNKTIKNNSLSMIGTGPSGVALRRFITRNTDTSYTIETYSGGTTANGERYLIPLYIIGYKTGMFN